MAKYTQNGKRKNPQSLSGRHFKQISEKPTFLSLPRNLSLHALSRERESRLVPAKAGNHIEDCGFPASSAGQALLSQE